MTAKNVHVEDWEVLGPRERNIKIQLDHLYEDWDILPRLEKLLRAISSVKLAIQKGDLAPNYLDEEGRTKNRAWSKAYQKNIDHVAGPMQRDRQAIAMGFFRDYVLSNTPQEKLEELEGCAEQLMMLRDSLRVMGD